MKVIITNLGGYGQAIYQSMLLSHEGAASCISMRAKCMENLYASTSLV